MEGSLRPPKVKQGIIEEFKRRRESALIMLDQVSWILPLVSSLLVYQTYCKALHNQRYQHIQELCLAILAEDNLNSNQRGNNTNTDFNHLGNEYESTDRSHSSESTDTKVDTYHRDSEVKEAIARYNRYRKIVQILSEVEMMTEFDSSLRFRGLLSTYSIPSISKTLHSTGGFETNCKRRYADMELILNEFLENDVPEDKISGQPLADPCIRLSKSLKDRLSDLTRDLHDDIARLDSAGDAGNILEVISSGQCSATVQDQETQSEINVNRPLRSLLRLNSIHHKYGNKILFQDMMYVLSVFTVAPIQWVEYDKWAIRPFSELEKECIYRYWVQVGNIMNLHVTDQWSNVQVR